MTTASSSRTGPLTQWHISLIGRGITSFPCPFSGRKLTTRGHLSLPPLAGRKLKRRAPPARTWRQVATTHPSARGGWTPRRPRGHRAAEEGVLLRRTPSGVDDA